MVRFFLREYCANSSAGTVTWITKSTTFIELVILDRKWFNRAIFTFRRILRKSAKPSSAYSRHSCRRGPVLKQNKNSPGHHPSQ